MTCPPGRRACARAAARPKARLRRSSISTETARRRRAPAPGREPVALARQRGIDLGDEGAHVQPARRVFIERARAGPAIGVLGHGRRVAGRLHAQQRAARREVGGDLPQRVLLALAEGQRMRHRHQQRRR
jgi:hypothetical protein